MLPHQAALRPTGRRQVVVDLEVRDGDDDRGEVGLVTSGSGDVGYAAELAQAESGLIEALSTLL